MLRVALVLSSALLLTGQLHAQLITWSSSGLGSEENFYLEASNGTVLSSNEVSITALPYTTPVSGTVAGNSITVTPNFTGSSLSLSESQSILGSTHDFAAGGATIDFVAQGNINYAISGTLTTTGGLPVYLFSQFALYNDTTNSYLYNSEVTTVYTSSVSLGPAAGSLTGSLIAGDIYSFFDSLDTQQGSQNISDSVTLTFSAAPEPSTWLLLFLGIGALCFCGALSPQQPTIKD